MDTERTHHMTTLFCAAFCAVSCFQTRGASKSCPPSARGAAGEEHQQLGSTGGEREHQEGAEGGGARARRQSELSGGGDQS